MRFRSAICTLALLAACPRLLFAQSTQQALPTSVKVLAIADVGDPATLPAIAMQETAISATSTLCNRTPSGFTVGLINPAYSAFDDPFNPGKQCVVPSPTSLPDGKYRTVGILVAATCIDIGTGQPAVNCEAPRSAASLVFTVAPILTRPAAAKGWGVKQ
jgi:hypothetical protein